MAPIKNLHVTLALLSVAGFSATGTWLVRHWPAARPRRVRTLPHIGDTAPFAAGLIMVVPYNPFNTLWLSAKMAGFAAYIFSCLRRFNERPALPVVHGCRPDGPRLHRP